MYTPAHLNERTNGPVNVHLRSGLGLNIFIQVLEYSPEVSTDNINIKLSVHLSIPSKFSQCNNIFVIQMHKRVKMILPKIGQCHPRVVIYTNFSGTNACKIRPMLQPG